eukprot:812040_1
MSFSGNRTLCAVIGFLVAVALATIAYRTIYRADVDNTASVDQDRNNLVNAVSVSQGLAKSGGSDERGASIKTELHIDPIVPNDQVDQGANVVQPADDGKSNDGEEPIVDADQENSKKVFKSVETNFDHSFEVVGPPKEEEVLNVEAPKEEVPEKEVREEEVSEEEATKEEVAEVKQPNLADEEDESLAAKQRESLAKEENDFLERKEKLLAVPEVPIELAPVEFEQVVHADLDPVVDTAFEPFVDESVPHIDQDANPPATAAQLTRDGKSTDGGKETVDAGLAKSGGSDDSDASTNTELHSDPIDRKAKFEKFEKRVNDMVNEFGSLKDEDDEAKYYDLHEKADMLEDDLEKVKDNKTQDESDKLEKLIDTLNAAWNSAIDTIADAGVKW